MVRTRNGRKKKANIRKGRKRGKEGGVGRGRGVKREVRGHCSELLFKRP